MLVVEQQRRLSGAEQRRRQQRYGYVLHQPGSGESSCCAFHDMPRMLLGSGGGGGGSEQPLLSGPLWLGPLLDHAHLEQVQQEAAARGWLHQGSTEAGAGREAAQQPQVPATRKGSVGSLALLLDLLVGEAAADAAAAALEQQQQQQQPCGSCASTGGLPPWFLRMHDVGRAGSLAGPPSRDKLAAELRRR